MKMIYYVIAALIALPIHTWAGDNKGFPIPPPKPQAPEAAPAVKSRSEIVNELLMEKDAWFKDDHGLQCTNSRLMVMELFRQVYGIENAVEEYDSKDQKTRISLWRTTVKVTMGRGGATDKDVAFALTGDNPTKLAVLLKSGTHVTRDSSFCLPNGFSSGTSNAILVKVSDDAVVAVTPKKDGTIDIATVDLEDDGSFAATSALLAGNFSRASKEKGASLLSTMGVAPVLEAKATQ